MNSESLQRLLRNFVTSSRKTCYISANSERKASSICPDRLPKFMEMLGLQRTRKPFPSAFWRLPMKKEIVVLALLGVLITVRSAAAQSPQPIRVGIIGLDTSHVIAFTKVLNDPTNPDHVPGTRVVAAFKGGSPDIESSRNRIEGFTAELRDKWKVEIVADIPTLCRKVDAVLLESVDGRPHLEQVKPVLAAKNRSSSTSLWQQAIGMPKRLPDWPVKLVSPGLVLPACDSGQKRCAWRPRPKARRSEGAIVWGPAPTEPHHPI